MSNQDPNSFEMEKRIFLVLVLSLAILMVTPYIYQRFFPAPPAQPRTSAPVPEQAPPPEVAESAPPEAPREVEVSATSGQPETRAEAQVVEVENDDLVLRWNSRGVVLESARLKRLGERGEDGKPVGPLELVPTEIPTSLPRPFQLRLEDEGLDRIVSKAVYAVDTGGRSGRLEAPVELKFEYRNKDVEVIRTVKVPASGYVVDMAVEVRAGGRSIPYAIFLGPGLGHSAYEAQGDFGDQLVAYHQGGSVTRYRSGDLDDGPASLEAPADWVAISSQYFAYLILDDDGVQRFVLKKSDWFQKSESGEQVRVPVLTAQVGMGVDSTFQAFFGPKEDRVLESVGRGLPLLVDYGWFGWLVQPLLFGLKFVNGWVDNYGWAIIILTFFINLALFPVRYKQMASMKKMADLQPKIRSIQDRYKRLKREDPKRQEMNAEMMALYREHGVNPLGGCLPLLVQMPFLFAFYRMLASSFELRGAPFIWWIRDLSKPDPYYVTPIVMGATWLIQQQMTPGGAGTDPTQRRMMLMMPIVFTFFFLNASSGLAIYFLFSNVFGMMFQLALQRWSPELAKAAPGAAKKR